ncbi:LemA family protein [Candidatus Burarchaeum australiense]|nr:LemA family protein [Candidatus Burarchaeum australiense]
MAKHVAPSAKPSALSCWLKLGIALALVLLLVFTVLGTQRNLAGLRENADSRWADAEAQYAISADSIPALLELTQGYAVYGQPTLAGIAQVQTQWAAARGSGADMRQKIAAARAVDDVVSKLLLVAQGYPQLRAGENFVALKGELETSENARASAIENYDSAAREYNQALVRFPNSLFSGLLGFRELPLFEQ